MSVINAVVLAANATMSVVNAVMSAVNAVLTAWSFSGMCPSGKDAVLFFLKCRLQIYGIVLK